MLGRVFMFMCDSGDTGVLRAHSSLKVFLSTVIWEELVLYEVYDYDIYCSMKIM